MMLTRFPRTEVHTLAQVESDDSAAAATTIGIFIARSHGVMALSPMPTMDASAFEWCWLRNRKLEFWIVNCFHSRPCCC